MSGADATHAGFSFAVFCVCCVEYTPRLVGACPGSLACTERRDETLGCDLKKLGVLGGGTISGKGAWYPRNKNLISSTCAHRWPRWTKELVDGPLLAAEEASPATLVVSLCAGWRFPPVRLVR